jgi:probable HAF family extracellular repeat protein
MKSKFLAVAAALAFFGLILPAFSQQRLGFLYSNGSYTTLSVPGASGDELALAFGINNSGEIVGRYTIGLNSYGFLYSNGNYTTLSDPLAPNDTQAQSINNLGEIVGSYEIGGEVYGFIYNNGTYTTLPSIINYPRGINDLGQIVDYNRQGLSVLYSGGSYTNISDPLATPPWPFSSTIATGINDAGQIVGYYNNETGTFGFLYSDGTYTNLGPITYDINNLGQRVGIDGNLSGDHANGFLYSNGSYTPIDDPLTFNGTHPFGINDSGQIVGYYVEGYVAGVPEPSTWAMMLIGFVGLGFAGYRRAKNGSATFAAA